MVKHTGQNLKSNGQTYWSKSKIKWSKHTGQNLNQMVKYTGRILKSNGQIYWSN